MADPHLNHHITIWPNADLDGPRTRLDCTCGWTLLLPKGSDVAEAGEAARQHHRDVTSNP